MGSAERGAAAEAEAEPEHEHLAAQVQGLLVVVARVVSGV